MEKIANGRPELGKPSAFNASNPEFYWLCPFTVTCRDPRFFDQMEAFSGNAAGTGGLVTFREFNWLMSVVLYRRPHFTGQPATCRCFGAMRCIPTVSAISWPSRCPIAAAPTS